jgi:hypothetical protein
MLLQESRGRRYANYCREMSVLLARSILIVHNKCQNNALQMNRSLCWNKKKKKQTLSQTQQQQQKGMCLANAGLQNLGELYQINPHVLVHVIFGNRLLTLTQAYYTSS